MALPSSERGPNTPEGRTGAQRLLVPFDQDGTLQDLAQGRYFTVFGNNRSGMLRYFRMDSGFLIEYREGLTRQWREVGETYDARDGQTVVGVHDQPVLEEQAVTVATDIKEIFIHP